MASPKLNSDPEAAQPGELLAPFLERPAASALIFDVDGTLAPIVPRPEQARVPESTRDLLRRLDRRYALVACISGRRAAEARRIVGIDSLAYVGNHGLETLPPGAPEARTDPSLADLAARVRSFATSIYEGGLARAGVRLEDKDAIFAFHWRGASDEHAAKVALERVATQAEQQGLVPHWGRKVLELRPPVQVDKGVALEAALAQSTIEQALYAGDDTTDLDAFRKLRELERSKGLRALCVGVASNEGPAAIAAESDLVVDGPTELVELLEALTA
jgi:trehalose 6-phosphate phosphatase